MKTVEVEGEEVLITHVGVNAMRAAWLAIAALILIALLLTTFLPATKLETKPMASYAEPTGVGEKGPE